jgi:hypothetical protein
MLAWYSICAFPASWSCVVSYAAMLWPHVTSVRRPQNWQWLDKGLLLIVRLRPFKTIFYRVPMPKNPECGIFQKFTPPLDRCCLCDSRGELHVEQRPTGRDAALQSWSYCSSCWEACQSNGNEPAVLACYLRFLRIVLNGTTGSTA